MLEISCFNFFLAEKQKVPQSCLCVSGATQLNPSGGKTIKKVEKTDHSYPPSNLFQLVWFLSMTPSLLKFISQKAYLLGELRSTSTFVSLNFQICFNLHFFIVVLFSG